MKNKALLKLIISSLGACLIAICSWTTIPLLVPFTLQTFAIFLLLVCFGVKITAISTTIYIGLGLIGLPVFSSFNSGFSVILGPTGGYIIGFFAIILIYFIITKIKESRKTKIISLLLGLLVCYLLGTLWYMIVYLNGEKTISFLSVITTCVLPFIIPDLVKLILSVIIGEKISPILDKYI